MSGFYKLGTRSTLQTRAKGNDNPMENSYYEQKPILQEKIELEMSMQSALDLVRRDKVSASKVKQMLETFHHERIERSMQDGVRATKKARLRVKEHFSNKY